MIHVFLFIYFTLYFLITFVLKSILIAKKIWKSPLVLPKDDSAYGLIGYYFRTTLVFMFVYVVLMVFSPSLAVYIMPILWIENEILAYIGMFLLFLSIIWTIIAQWNMKNSWRIGIDTVTKTELVTIGLFQYSRNPIFFGMILTLFWFFLVTPNMFTLLFLLIGYVLIQIQIRLEEEFLLSQHGELYAAYTKKVRRII